MVRHPTMTDRHPLVRVPIRFPALFHRLLVEASERHGISLSQYVREAALMRLAWERGLNTDMTSDQSAQLEAMLTQMRTILRELEDASRRDRR